MCLAFLTVHRLFFIAAGFKRECGKIYEMSLEQEDLYEMEKKKRESSARVSGTRRTCECGGDCTKTSYP